MAYHDATDSMSLHTLGDSDEGTEIEEAESVSGLRERDDEVPSCFLDQKVTLETPPVLLGHYRHVRKLLHGAGWRRQLIVISTWISILAHAALVAHFDHGNAQPFHRWTPPIIATFLITITVLLTIYEIHALSQKPGREKGLLINRLHLSTGIIICIICPILSIPLFDTCSIQEETIRHGPSTRIVQIPSAADLLPMLQFSSPLFAEKKDERPRWNDWLIRSTDKWVPKPHEDNIGAFFPDAFTFFNLDRHGKGEKEHRWNDWDDSEARPIFMPFYPLSKPVFDPAQLNQEWRAQGKLFILGLDCEYLEVRQDPILQPESSDGIEAVLFNVTDRDECTASVRLEASPLTQSLREDMLDVVSMMETLQKDLFMNGNDLFYYKPVQVLADTHRRLSTDDDICSSRLFLAALTDILWGQHSVPNAKHIQAASCRTTHHLGSGEIQVSRNIRGFFYDHADFMADPSIVIDEVNINALNGNFGRKFDFMEDWDGGDVTRNLSRAFLRSAARFSLDDDPTWPLTLFREWLGDGIWDRPRPLGSLIMLIKALQLNFASELSNAAGLALQEKLSHISEAAYQSEYVTNQAKLMRTQRMARDVFQARMSVRVCLYLTVISMSYFLLDLDRLVQWTSLFAKAEQTQKIEGAWAADDFQSPWDISSIAARLALLRHSRIREWLKHESWSPSIVEDTPPIKIGQWLVHDKDEGKSGWRVDAPDIVFDGKPLSSRCDPGQQTVRQPAFHRYSGSTPPHASPRAALETTLALFLYCFVQYSVLTSRPGGEGAPHDQKMTAMLLGVAGPPENPSIWWIIISVILPGSLIYAVAFLWLPWLYNFYKIRRPWLSLETPKAAHLSITLDYWNCNLSLLKALKNRHWDIAALAIVCFISLVIPASHAFLSCPIWTAKPLEKLQVTRNFKWRVDLADFPSITGPFHQTYNGLFKSLGSTKTLEPWSSHKSSIIPPTIHQKDTDFQADYWVYNTSSIQGFLECEKAHIEVALVERITLEGPFYSVDKVAVSSDDKFDPLVAEYQQPCLGDENAFRYEEPYFPPRRQSKSMCSRWWLQNNHTNHTAEFGAQSARWLVAVLWGSAITDIHRNEILFDSAPTALCLVCRPVLTVGNGTAILSFGFERRFGFAQPVKYASWGVETETTPDLAGTISHFMNRSLYHIDSKEGGVLARSKDIYMDGFVGDLLSYALYRYSLAGEVSKLNAASLAHDASVLFASYIANLAHTSDVLKIPGYEEVEVQPYEIPGTRRVDTWALVAMAVCVSSFLAVCLCVALAPDSSLLPYPPEPLLNSLFLLCHSKIVEIMETEFDSPEQLSLKKFYEVIESWGFKYQLMTIDDGGVESKMVVETVEEPEPGEYRDDA